MITVDTINNKLHAQLLFHTVAPSVARLSKTGRFADTSTARMPKCSCDCNTPLVASSRHPKVCCWWHFSDMPKRSDEVRSSGRSGRLPSPHFVPILEKQRRLPVLANLTSLDNPKIYPPSSADRERHRKFAGGDPHYRTDPAAAGIRPPDERDRVGNYPKAGRSWRSPTPARRHLGRTAAGISYSGSGPSPVELCGRASVPVHAVFALSGVGDPSGSRREGPEGCGIAVRFRNSRQSPARVSNVDLGLHLSERACAPVGRHSAAVRHQRGDVALASKSKEPRQISIALYFGRYDLPVV